MAYGLSAQRICSAVMRGDELTPGAYRARADRHQLPHSLRSPDNSLLGLTVAGTLAARLSVSAPPVALPSIPLG